MIRAAWAGRERRTRERCKVLIPCKLSMGTRVLMGKTDDISLTGACFAPAEDDFKMVRHNASGVFELLLPSAVFRADCRVVRIGRAEIGLEFVGHHGTDAYAALLDFLETQLSRVC
ncbi:MAG: PilZ domain-containing protein [Myxococcota bacterium]|nr:PilZ domain-containing protein [Myxococcota bacterium]